MNATPGGIHATRTSMTAPAKAEPVELDREAAVGKAVRELARNCVEQLKANAPGVGNLRSDEYLHQARIALRRLRCALRLVRATDHAVEELKAGFRHLSRYLGAARDWDVLLADTLPPIARAYAEAGHDAAPISKLQEAARRKRARARNDAQKALHSPEYRALLARLESWLDTPLAGAQAGVTLKDFAADELRKRHKRLLRQKSLEPLTPQQRHRVRVKAKRLRYAMEFFGSLFAAGPVKRYRRRLSALQDALGYVNDTATARRLVRELPAAGTSGQFIDGWLAAREAAFVAESGDRLGRLGGRRRFWKHPN